MAGAVPKYIECNDAYVLDTDDLRAKVTPETKYLMLTHMRGKLANMQATGYGGRSGVARHLQMPSRTDARRVHKEATPTPTSCLH